LRLCLQSGDQALWAEFVHHVQPLIARVVVKSVRSWTKPSSSLVDDLVHDTYLKLCSNDFRALRELRCQNEAALFGFLKVVASRVVQDHFRSLFSQKHGGGNADEDLEQIQVADAASGACLEQAERSILLTEVEQCLELRSAEPNFNRDCTIFWLYYQQGLTAKEISELPSIGLTEKGVESSLLKLTRWVRAGLGGRGKKGAAGG